MVAAAVRSAALAFAGSLGAVKAAPTTWPGAPAAAALVGLGTGVILVLGTGVTVTGLSGVVAQVPAAGVAARAKSGAMLLPISSAVGTAANASSRARRWPP